MAQVLPSYERSIAESKIPAGKKKVLLAAIHLFAKQGFHATTTAAIAKESGMSEGTIYKYFSSKKDLLIALLTPLLIAIRDNFFSKLNQAHSLDQLVDFIINDRLNFAFDNFELIQILLQEVLTDRSMLASLAPLLNAEDGLNQEIRQLQKTYPAINQQLVPSQIIRILLGPLLVYVGQVKLVGIRSHNKQFERQIIHQQIVAGLTVK
ncbi:TetR/AcrR family transcriptional regulator [Limosilactobacillus difficilis]|uniref:TetR/AcrR family transcriptional regulator n=1 Tax=Limosilactobacillus difficilis TaxID=2991838 RepID=UPI0024BBDF42|nr:TetR/AcrR family transcriptional regulator [Limosilactobacillus difficilis]